MYVFLRSRRYAANTRFSSFGNPFDRREFLLNLCSGVEASTVVANDLLNAATIGKTASEAFTDERRDREKPKQKNRFALQSKR